MIDTTMSSKPPQGIYTSHNITDEIAEQLIRNNAGFLKYFSDYPIIDFDDVSPELSDDFKVGVLVPTRGNRSMFLHQAKKMIARQSVRPNFIEIVDDKPKSNAVDITWRYRTGCERLVAKGADVIVFWEDDDWYAKKYIETMVKKWAAHGKPTIFGIDSTVYYHLITNKFRKFEHPNRASMMSTMVTKDIINKKCWPDDDYAYCDLHLWKELNGKTFQPETQINIGIKHGIGLVGGGGHQIDWERYNSHDHDMSWLLYRIPKIDHPFYQSIAAMKHYDFKTKQYSSDPFVSIITRKHGDNRPKGFANNQQSIKAQTDQNFEQVFIIDNEGRGLAEANKSLAYVGNHIQGKYVVILDDDDFFVNDNFVKTMRSIHDRFDPDVIMIKMIILNGVNNNIYPTDRVWKKTPIAGQIGMTCFVVKREVYMKHRLSFDRPRMGDFNFIDAVFADGRYKIHWHPHIQARTTRVGRGRTEAE